MKQWMLTAAAMLVAGPVLADEIKLSGSNTKIEFVGKKTDGKHDGGFKTVKGTVSVPGGDFAKAKITVEIDTESIYSDDDKLTKHLKSPDFFNVAKHKTAKFVSKKIVKDGDKYTITGDLTLNGKTESIEIPATVSNDGGKINLKSEFAIDRTKFGMTYGKGKINDQVDLKLAIDAK